jgi:hypothetical protein
MRDPLGPIVRAQLRVKVSWIACEWQPVPYVRNLKQAKLDEWLVRAKYLAAMNNRRRRGYYGKP